MKNLIGMGMEPAETADLGTPDLPNVALRAGMLLLLVLPVAGCIMVGTDTPRNLLVACAVSLLIAGAFWRGYRRQAWAMLPLPMLLVLLVPVFLVLAQIPRATNLSRGVVGATSLVAGPLIALVLIAIPEIRTHLRKTLGWFLLAMGLLVAAVGWAQNFGLSLPECWLTIHESRAPAALFGESNTGGIWCSLALPLLVGGCLASSAKWPWLVGIAALSGYHLISGSRASFLGFAGAVAFLALMAFRGSPAIRRSGRGLALAVGFMVIGWALGFSLLKGKPQETYVAELGSPSNLNFRVDSWSSTLGQWAANPLLGVGPGNFGREHQRFRTAVGSITAGVIDNKPESYRVLRGAHQTWLHLLAETGPIPTLAFLFVMVGAVWHSWNAVLDIDPWRPVWGATLVAFLVAGNFNSVNLMASHWTLVWMTAGLLWGESTAGGFSPRPGASFLLWTIPVLVMLASLPILAMRWHGRHRLAVAMQNGLTAERAEAAVKADPWGTEVRAAALRAWIGRGDGQRALAHARRLLEWEPGNPNLVYLAGRAAALTGSRSEATAWFGAASSLAPGWAAPRLRLAELQGGPLELFEEAARLHPSWGEARFRYGVALGNAGRFTEAAGELAASAERGWNLAPELARVPWASRPEFGSLRTGGSP